jgi:hypothetical protein
MPMMWLRAHAQAIPELQGEECFQGAEVFAVGAGKLKRSDHERAVRRWSGAMGRGSVSIRGGVDLGRLAALGIKVRHESR